MGYAVLHMEKAVGSDSGMSAHIERTVAPKNADASRTHLNWEIITFPDGVTNRTEAIQHRLETAGLQRKIGKNQVRAVRIMLSGSPDDMVRRLFNKETVVASGELYSKEHSKRFKVESASLKLEQDKAKPENIRFTINGTDIFDWFKLKQKEFLNSLGINPKEKKEIKM